MNEKLQKMFQARVFDLIKKKGDRCSISELCAELSISRDTLYRHMKSKEDLIRELMRVRFAMHKDRLVSILAREEDYLLLLHEVIAALRDLVEDFDGIELRAYPELIRENASEIAGMLSELTAYLEQGIQRGYLREDLDAALLTEMIHLWIVAVLNEGRNKNDKIEPFLKIILHGILKT